MPSKKSILFALAGGVSLSLSSTASGQETNQEASLFGFFTALEPTLVGWTATVITADRLPKDPLWTAVVYARRGTAIETGSLTPRAVQNGPRITGAAHAMSGLASFYSQEQMTASGEAFNKNGMTAAHKTLPLGTTVKVTNLDNGRTAVVRINDRGPFVGDRVIDVSEAAADVLGMRTQGVAPVRVDLVGH